MIVIVYWVLAGMTISKLETKFGTFAKQEIVTLRLSRDRLSDKSMLIFEQFGSKFDFERVLEQLINTGIKIHWFDSKMDFKNYGWNHIAIIDQEDVHLVKILQDEVKVFSSNELYEELDKIA